ncbi:hypothetical protein FB475_0928 [Kribbella jejuensis]|uniref:Uncharacterized protein n=1 Tax=Kribbella jejuensis TaxID=236068 RepID=A0A542EN95_9ACTN|nr:hypothetical protein FB475_0928 [Kribbella jejuensis]
MCAKSAHSDRPPCFLGAEPPDPAPGGLRPPDPHRESLRSLSPPGRFAPLAHSAAGPLRSPGSYGSDSPRSLACRGRPGPRRRLLRSLGRTGRFAPLAHSGWWRRFASLARVGLHASLRSLAWVRGSASRTPGVRSLRSVGRPGRFAPLARLVVRPPRFARSLVVGRAPLDPAQVAPLTSSDSDTRQVGHFASLARLSGARPGPPLWVASLDWLGEALRFACWGGVRGFCLRRGFCRRLFGSRG